MHAERVTGRPDLPMDPRTPITVAIARFEDLVALGLRTLLADDPSVSIVAYDVASARIPTVLRAHRPRVLILDVAQLLDLGQVRALTLEFPLTHLVLLSTGRFGVESSQLLAFGASACLRNDTQARELPNAIHLASRGLQLMPLGAPDLHGAQVRDSLLTPREGDVLLLLRQGRSNAQIASALHISVETVRSHARHVYRKLGISSRRGLVALSGAAAPVPAPAARSAADRRSWRRALSPTQIHRAPGERSYHLPSSGTENPQIPTTAP